MQVINSNLITVAKWRIKAYNHRKVQLANNEINKQMYEDRNLKHLTYGQIGYKYGVVYRNVADRIKRYKMKVKNENGYN